MDTDKVPLSHFSLLVLYMHAKETNFIFGMPQIYTCTDTQKYAHTSAETPAHTETGTAHKHKQAHMQTIADQLLKEIDKKCYFKQKI